MTRRPVVRGAMVFDPARRTEIEGILRRLRRPTLLLVPDVDAQGRSDPVGAMAQAWSALTEDEARSVFVIRDIARPLPGGVARAVSALRRVPPGSGIALHTAADSPHNAYRVRLAALTGHGLVELQSQERAPTLFLLFDGVDAARIARILGGRGGGYVEAERIMADTLHALGIRVFAVVPHPMDRREPTGQERARRAEGPVGPEEPELSEEPGLSEEPRLSEEPAEPARSAVPAGSEGAGAGFARATLAAVAADRPDWAVLSAGTIEGIGRGWIPVYRDGRTQLERFVGTPEGNRVRQNAHWSRAAELLGDAELPGLTAHRPGVSADHEAFVAGVLLGWGVERVPRAGLALREDRLRALTRAWAQAAARAESAARIEELAARIRAGIAAMTDAY
ncbi:hypothetical protein M2390_000405 [Mycetocola sp. BIGb0189]|uniref:hypothetical protein n=1 Tax=Mycetocola sp. BIGb0189 TaxID=2940604 RepID=UPI0021694282|nr:hypothetical protein [Mycetocola sp. BIGb0189]MCS4275247.1 hypothetical protein [Mycetocola sp. BIGb0189]